MSLAHICWRVYRIIVFPLLHAVSGGGTVNGCRHEPSCSVYALQVIERNGWLRGAPQALKRVMSCHPWGK